MCNCFKWNAIVAVLTMVYIRIYVQAVNDTIHTILCTPQFTLNQLIIRHSANLC